MTLKPMPKGVVGDKNTKLVSPFTAGVDTQVTVADGSVIPQATPTAPNYASIRMPNKSCLVTFQYSGVVGNTLTGVNVIEADSEIGLTAVYPVGSKVYWSLTNVELSSIIDNIVEIAGATGVGHASKDVYGIVRIGDGIEVNDGVISVGSGTDRDYNLLINKPKINGVEVKDELTSEDLGLVSGEEGKGLSSNDFTDTLKLKLEGIDVAGAISSHNTDSNAHPYWAERIEGKVDKVEGKGLSDEDYTLPEKRKLASIEYAARRNKIDYLTVKGELITPVQEGDYMWATIPAASQSKYGAVKIGSGISCTDGVISVDGAGNDYEGLINKPKIDGVELVGNKSLDELGIASDVEVDTVDVKINTHIANKDNPHAVSKAQIGLGNVDNTSDEDKPISAATQLALNQKLNLYATINDLDKVPKVQKVGDEYKLVLSTGGSGGECWFSEIKGEPTDNTNLSNELSAKVTKYQGTENVGKYLMVDSNGYISLVALHPKAGEGADEGTLIFSDGQASAEDGTLIL